MRPQILVFIAAIIGVALLLRWFMRNSPATVARGLRWASVAALIAGLVFLAATGRLHWLFALGASMLPFVKRLLPLARFLPLLRGLGGAARRARNAAGPSTGRVSTVTSRFLEMTLDHDSGAMDGRVLEGMHRDRNLSELDLHDLVTMLSQYRSVDPDSAALLEAWLDRAHGDAWRADAAAAGESAAGPARGDGPMTEHEARQILGVDDDAGEEDIIAAHRRLMQRLHPDRGGSDYLAAKINQAKRVLLPRDKV